MFSFILGNTRSSLLLIFFNYTVLNTSLHNGIENSTNKFSKLDYVKRSQHERLHMFKITVLMYSKETNLNIV